MAVVGHRRVAVAEGLRATVEKQRAETGTDQRVETILSGVELQLAAVEAPQPGDALGTSFRLLPSIAQVAGGVAEIALAVSGRAGVQDDPTRCRARMRKNTRPVAINVSFPCGAP
jgi:hypothetical protein